jgi:serine/threonine-protein kinase
MTTEGEPSLDDSPPLVAGTPTRYQLRRKLGRGGMAEVFLATMHGAQGFAREVAVKLIREDYAQNPSFCQALTEEARLAAGLHHSNVVSVFDYNCDATGRPFLVMEYVDGIDLAHVVGSRGPLPFSVTAFLVGEVLRGLGHAHAPRAAAPRGLVHRDLSPQNVLLSREGAVKLSDFGIAKALTSSGVVGPMVGKAAYMAPEQVRQEPLDTRADLFAAGIVLWELLAGQPLFQRASVQQIFEQILFENVRRPRDFRRDVPPDLEAVAMRLLRPVRELRTQRAEEALDELTACRDMPRNGPAELASFLAGAPARSLHVSDPERVTETLPPMGGDVAIANLPLMAEPIELLGTGAPKEGAREGGQIAAPGRRQGPRLALWAAGAALALAAGLFVVRSLGNAPAQRETAPPSAAEASSTPALRTMQRGTFAPTPIPAPTLPPSTPRESPSALPAPREAPATAREHAHEVPEEVPAAHEPPPPPPGKARPPTATRSAGSSGFIEIPLNQRARSGR